MPRREALRAKPAVARPPKVGEHLTEGKVAPESWSVESGPRRTLSRAPLLQAEPEHTQVALARRALASKLSPQRSAPPSSVFDLLGFGPVDGQPLLLTGDNPFIGDSFVHCFSRIAALHERFPNSKISVFSRFAPMLRHSSWLDPVAVDATKALEEQPQVTQHFRPGAFLLHTLDGRRFLDLALENDVPALGLSGAHASESNLRFSSTLVAPSSFLRDRGRLDPSVLQLRGKSPSSRMQAAQLDAAVPSEMNPTASTVYEGSDFRSRFDFGDAQAARLPLEFLVDTAAQARPVRQFLEQAFPGRGDHRTAIFNFNTAGTFKLKHLVDDCDVRMKLFVEQALRSDPHLNVLVTEPEPKFGPEVLENARALAARYAGRVAFMPADKALWLPLIHDADYVVSQDSGFTHVALVGKSEDRVLTFGPKDTGAKTWRKPGQPFVELELPAGPSGPISPRALALAGMDPEDVALARERHPPARTFEGDPQPTPQERRILDWIAAQG